MKEGDSMKKKIIIIVFLIIFILMLIELYIDASWIQTTRFEVSSDKVPASFDGYKILQLSDLHSKEFGQNNEKLLERIDASNPDIIVLTGDFVTANETDFTVFFELVDKISPKYEVYYITGNHEQAMSGSSKKEIFSYLSEKGVKFLNNEHIEIGQGEEKINLYGLCYESAYYSGRRDNIYTQEMMAKSLGEADLSKFNLLLTHSPTNFEVYKTWGADLILSGHVHGGMIRVPFVGAIFSPDEGFMPKYSAGRYQMDDSVLVVSRGLGRGSRGFRLFNRPNLVEITLKST